MFEYEKAAKAKQVGAKSPEEQARVEVERGWRWTQTEDDVEVTVAVKDGAAARVRINYDPLCGIDFHFCGIPSTASSFSAAASSCSPGHML